MKAKLVLEDGSEFPVEVVEKSEKAPHSCKGCAFVGSNCESELLNCAKNHTIYKVKPCRE